MKSSIFSILFCLACVARSLAGDFRIEYHYAGLTDIKVTEQKQLHFAWHTGRLPFDKNDTSPLLQSLEAYDSHSAILWLTKPELEQFRKWMESNKILDMPSAYPEAEQKTYGSAFQSSLTVVRGENKKHIAWNGDSKIPAALNQATDQLVQLCQEIRKSREGK